MTKNKERILDVLESIFLNWDRSEFMPSTRFIEDLGADSLDLVELIMGIEDEFGIEIPDEEARKVVSVGDIIKLVNRMVA